MSVSLPYTLKMATGNVTVKATLVDENGETVIDVDGNEKSDSKQLTSKAGFFKTSSEFQESFFSQSE